MRIQQLKLENFRGFEELTIDFPEKGSAVLIGVNGAGKSSVLEAVSLLINSLLKETAPRLFPDISELHLSDDDIKYSKSSLSIVSKFNFEDSVFNYSVTFPLTLQKKNHEKITTHILEQRKKNGTVSLYPCIISFRSNRIMEDGIKNPMRGLLGYSGVFNQITSFDGFINWFETRENFENQQKLEREDFNYFEPDLDIVRKALISFLNEIPSMNFSDLKMKRYKKNEQQVNFDSDIESFLSITKNGQIFKINQLSDGEKMTIMLVADITKRLILSDAHLENPLQGKGIVLIDEIDLHLHPSWQRAIIPALEKTFPNIQFIVTTHSPQVLSTIKKENVFILEDFKLVKETPHTFGQDSNSILYNIFGIEERPEQAAKDFKKLYRLIDEERLEEAEKTLEEMSEKYGYYDSEIVRAKMHLDFNHH